MICPNCKLRLPARTPKGVALAVLPVAAVVAEEFGIELVDLLSASRCQPVATARHFLMAALVESGIHPRAVERMLGYSRGLADYAVSNVRDMIQTYQSLRALWNKIIQRTK